MAGERARRLFPMAAWMRLVALALSGGIAIYAGFLMEPAEGMLHLQGRFGFHACLASFAFLLICLWLLRRDRPRREAPAGPPDGGLIKVSLLAGGLVAVAIVAIGPKPRILVDEAHLIGVSYAMYQGGDNVLWEQALQLQGGAFRPLSFSYNKRPPAFPALLALTHRVSGYRLGNVYALNAVAGFAALVLVFVLGRSLAGPVVGLVSLGTMASFPLFWACVTSAGFETVNLAMLLAGLVLALRLDRERSWRAVSALLALAAVLALVRYESALISAAFVAFAVLRAPYRDMQGLSLPVILAPLAFVPAAWQLFVPFATEVGAGQTAFSPAHVPVNLLRAAQFFLNQGEAPLSAPLAAMAGFAGLALCILRPASWRACAYPLLLLGVLLLWAASVLSYWHGDFSRLITARLALPLLVAIALGSGWLLRAIATLAPLRSWPLLYLAVLIVQALPALAMTDQSLRNESADVFRQTAQVVQQLPVDAPILLVAWPGGWFSGLGVGTLDYQNVAENLAMLESLLAQGLVAQILVVDILEPISGQPRFDDARRIPGQLTNIREMPLSGGASLRVRRWAPEAAEGA